MSDNGRELNLKQLEFVQEYLSGEHAGNGTRAYMKVYGQAKENSAAVCASELLRDPKVEELVKEHRERVQTMSASWLELAEDAKARLVELSRTARSESVRYQCLKEILDRGFGKPEQRLTVKEEKELTSQAVRSYARRLAEVDAPVAEVSSDDAVEVLH